MRPYHMLQVLALILGIVVVLRSPGAAGPSWMQSAGGWLGMLGMLLIALFAIAAGGIGLVIGLRTRGMGNFLLGLFTFGIGIAVIARGIIAPLR